MVNFDVTNPESIEFLKYKQLKDLQVASKAGAELEIDFILGSLPTERHILEYTRDNPNRIVYCINIVETEIDENWTIETDEELTYDANNESLNYLKADFNSKNDWETLSRIFTGQISQIIFDSSTAKFIQANDHMWRLEDGGFRPIKRILKPNGRLICESLHTGCATFPRDFGLLLGSRQAVEMTIGTLPFCYHHPVGTTLTYEQMQTFTSQQRFDQVEASTLFQDYMEKIRQEASYNGFRVTYHHNSQTPYPLTKTRYPITNYAVFTSNY